MSKREIIIFGASLYGKIAYKILSKQFEIVAFADNSELKWGKKFCDKLIIKAEDIATYKNVEIVIASWYYSAIGQQLKEMGIKPIKVFVYKGELVDAQEYHADYELIEIDFKDIYANVKLDLMNMRNIVNDFSLNYSLNNSRRKKVLFFAYYFPPLGGSGVQRSVKFVKYLRNFGYEPIVVTVGKTLNRNETDEKMIEDIPQDIQIVRIDNDLMLAEQISEKQQQEIINLYYGIVQSEDWINEYIRIIREDINQMNNILIPDINVYWVNQVLAQIEKEINMTDIDLIFTSGSPYSLYFLGYYIKNKYHIPWVMDDRDAWIANDYLAEQAWFKGKRATCELEFQLNGKLLNAADWLVVVANQVKDDYVQKFGMNCNQISVITNGYDEADFDTIKTSTKNDKFTLCYNGWVTLNRNPAVVLDVLNEMIEMGYMDSQKIEWIFNGVLQREKRELLLEKDKYHILKFNGYLEHVESLSIASQADVLILFGGVGEGSKVMYTGKVFEYLRLKKPILGISTPGGLYDELFARTQSGCNYDFADTEGMKKYLLGLYHAWINNETAYKPIMKEIEVYERRNLTKELAAIFEQVMDESAR